MRWIKFRTTSPEPCTTVPSYIRSPTNIKMPFLFFSLEKLKINAQYMEKMIHGYNEENMHIRGKKYV